MEVETTTLKTVRFPVAEGTAMIRDALSDKVVITAPEHPALTQRQSLYICKADVPVWIEALTRFMDAA